MKKESELQERMPTATVKYNSHCAVKKMMQLKRVTYELHDSCFRSMTITPAIPKIE